MKPKNKLNIVVGSGFARLGAFYSFRNQLPTVFKFAFDGSVIILLLSVLWVSYAHLDTLATLIGVMSPNTADTVNGSSATPAPTDVTTAPAGTDSQPAAPSTSTGTDGTTPSADANPAIDPTVDPAVDPNAPPRPPEGDGQPVAPDPTVDPGTGGL